jgi:predicted nucleotidyltransferase
VVGRKRALVCRSGRSRAEVTTIDGKSIKVISLDDLITNKRAAGRPQDLLDAEFLERVRARTTGQAGEPK